MRERMITALIVELLRQQSAGEPYVDAHVGQKDTPPTVKIDGDIDIGALADAALAALK